MTFDRNDDQACGICSFGVRPKLRAVANDVRHLSEDRADLPEKVQALRGELDFIISRLRHNVL